MAGSLVALLIRCLLAAGVACAKQGVWQRSVLGQIVSTRFEKMKVDRVVDTGTRPSLLDLRGIKKSFGGVRALRGVSFDLRAGEIHALLGENGAGKSTLIKTLGGIHTPDAGEILMEGRPTRISSPAEAARLGI